MEEAAQTPNTPPVIPPQAPSSSRNLLPIVVVAVTAALLASLGTYMVMSSNQNKQLQMSYQQTPTITQVTPSPTSSINSNMQTFTHSKYPYTLQYPNGWYAYEMKETYNTPGEYRFSRANPSDVEASRDDQTFIGIRVWEDSKLFKEFRPNTTPKSYFDSFYAQPTTTPPSGAGHAKTENLIVDGLPAVKEVGHAPIEPTSSVTVTVYKAPYLYDIYVWQGKGYTIDKDIMDVFNQVVSNFKFTK